MKIKMYRPSIICRCTFEQTFSEVVTGSFIVLYFTRRGQLKIPDTMLIVCVTLCYLMDIVMDFDLIWNIVVVKKRR